jgi:DNA-binding MarR family transcriptional regulator
MKKEIEPRLHASDLGPCVCAQVRRLARKLTSHYDSILAPTGLTLAQYSLLAHIDRDGPIPHTVLAEKVGMERTTLTRNLHVLLEGELVSVVQGKDRRQHLLKLTRIGKQKLVRSLPRWERAQRQFLTSLGPETTHELNSVLQSVETAVTKISQLDGDATKRRANADPNGQKK